MNNNYCHQMRTAIRHRSVDKNKLSFRSELHWEVWITPSVAIRLMPPSPLYRGFIISFQLHDHSKKYLITKHAQEVLVEEFYKLHKFFKSFSLH